MIAGKQCPLCLGRGFYIGTKDGYSLRHCSENHPSVLLSWQWESPEHYLSFYTSGQFHTTHQEAFNGRGDEWERDDDKIYAGIQRVRQILALYPDTKQITDFGAGTGALTLVAGAFGITAWGVEPGEIAEEARYRGRNVVRASLGNQPIALAEDVECITLIDVFEHLLNPRASLLLLGKMLAKDGVLVIEMPEWYGPQDFNEGLECRHVRPLEHLVIYSERAFTDLARSYGFEVDAIVRPLRGSLQKITYYLRLRK